MTRGPYNTLEKRLLAVLATGPRKRTVLAALASNEEQFRRTLVRMQAAGAVTTKNHRRGGIEVALARRTD